MSVGPTLIVINRGQDLVEAVRKLGLVRNQAQLPDSGYCCHY
jgi:hypothetical protein